MADRTSTPAGVAVPALDLQLVADLARKAAYPVTILLDTAGKRPLPTVEDCRRMADTLGIPSPYLRPYPPLAARPDPKEWR